MKQFLTVIICTYNRADLLLECLKSIYENPYCRSIKVLVIDNGSRDHTQKIITDFKSKWDNFEAALETKTGLSNARNKGLQLAKTEWIGFIDDDSKIGRDFIPIALDIIQNEKFHCFGGTYYPWYKFGKPQWIKEEWFTKSILLEKRGKLKQDFLSGGIFFIKKEVLEKVNGFEPQLGMQGKEVKYGEEETLQNKLRSKGYQIGYDPNLFIHHMVLPYKLKLNWRFKVAFAKGKKWQDFENPPLLKIIKTFIISFIGFLIKRTPIAIYCLLTKRNFYWQNALIDTFSPFSYYYGAILQKIKQNRLLQKISEGLKILKLVIHYEFPKVKFRIPKSINKPVLVFHFHKRPPYKYLYNLFLLLAENKTKVCLIPSVSFYKYLDVYGVDLLKNLDYKILLFKPNIGYCFSDTQKEEYGNISCDYLTNMMNLPGNSFVFPLLLHPYIYKNQLHMTFEPQSYSKNIKLFFQGNTGKHYDTVYSNKYFGVSNRPETISFLLKNFNPIQPINVPFNELLQDPVDLLIINSKNNHISEKEYLQLLSSSDFFLALPGFRAPTCHNVYEAIFCGSIPIIHKNLIPFFGGLLKSNQNCLVYFQFRAFKNYRSGYY